MRKEHRCQSLHIGTKNLLRPIKHRSLLFLLKNGTRSDVRDKMGIYDFTIYDSINQNAFHLGEKKAWLDVDGNEFISFREYKSKVDKIAAGLQKKGVIKGDRIGALGKNSHQYFLLYGAAAALGAIMLPINWRLSEEEIYFNLNDCLPKIVFADNEYQDLVRIMKKKLSSVEHFISFDKGEELFDDFDSLMQDGECFARAEVGSDEGFVIIHTAAVHGKPRGALLSHRNVLCTSMHLNYSLNIREHDVYLNIIPLFHVGGLFNAFASFQAGALIVNMSKFDPVSAVEIIQKTRVSIILEFSPMLSSIIEQLEKKGADITSLRTVIGLDNHETIEKYQKITGGSFYSIYGQTETSSMVTLGGYDERPGSAGRALPLADIRIIDDLGQQLGLGEVGEIAVKGPLVFQGYWNLPEDNAYIFRDGFLHTGDLGCFDENGFLWYKGRMSEKELIKPGGENVYPAEVENIILKHKAVEKVVVFGVPDPKWKEAIKAVVKLKNKEKLDAQELIDFVGDRIARYKKPQYVEFITELPLLKNGMPDRAKIKELYGANK